MAFLDAKALIDVLERQAPLAYQVTNRIGPIRRNDPIALGRFDAFSGRPDLCWVELSALQAACCLFLGADAVMISGDRGFRRLPGLPHRPR